MGEKEKWIENRVFITIGILGFLGGMICFTPNMTGNVIGELSKDSSNFLGLILLAIGFLAIWVARIKN
jgi:hypothetical protein